jgi:hypothetical protein
LLYGLESTRSEVAKMLLIKSKLPTYNLCDGDCLAETFELTAQRPKVKPEIKESETVGKEQNGKLAMNRFDHQ